MASDKQIAANRANAEKSTGPKTATGKLKSSQNSRRHGLCTPLELDTSALAKTAAITRALATDEADESKRVTAEAFAHAQLELERIRMVRMVRMVRMGAADPEHSEIRTLRQLVSLDRYERYKITKRRKASRKL